MKLDAWWRQRGREYVKKYLKVTGFRRIYEITFWLTHRCVYNCKFCVIEENTGPFMPKEMVFSVVEAALPTGLKTVALTGGDPMLHPDFVEICHYVKDKVNSADIHTTGKLLNKEILAELEKKNRRWPFWMTIVSNKAEVNDRYRAKGSLDDVKRATELLRERGHPYSIAINVVPESLPQLPETIEFAFNELKAPFVTTEPIGLMGRAALDPAPVVLNDEQLHQYYQYMTDLIPEWAAKKKRLDCIHIFYNPTDHCRGMWSMNGFNVHPDGLVNPCCYFIDEEGGLGNIKDGVKECTSLARHLALEKRLGKTHLNVAERQQAVGIWSCFECLLNYQIHNKGRKDLVRKK